MDQGRHRRCSVKSKNGRGDFPGGVVVKNPPARGFPGGAVVESPPADAEDTGLCPGPGRSHMPWSGWAREPQLLSLRATTAEPTCHNY